MAKTCMGSNMFYICPGLITLHSHTPPLYHSNQTNQGIDCILPSEAEKLAGRDPDYGIKDLYESIASNNPVSTPRPRRRTT